MRKGGTGGGAAPRSRDERAATREREVTRFALRPRDDRARIRLDVARRDRVFEGSDGEGHESKCISRLLHGRSRVFVTSRRIGVFQHPPRRRAAVRREPRFFPGRLLRLLFRGTSRASLSVHTFTLFQRCERNHRTHPALFWTASIFEFPARRPRSLRRRRRRRASPRTSHPLLQPLASPTRRRHDVIARARIEYRRHAERATEWRRSRAGDSDPTRRRRNAAPPSAALPSAEIPSHPIASVRST